MPTLPPSFCTPAQLAKGAGITMGVNAAIALALWVGDLGPLDEQMVHSQAIGLSIWALVNAGAAWLSRPQDSGGFPRGWRAAVLVPVAVGTGVVLGTVVGHAYAGRSTWDMAQGNPRLLGWILAMSLGVGLAMTLYFYLAGKGNYLQTELERTQRLAAEAQLALLQSQLEPHMLFNTLANLRVLIALDADKAQTMLDHLIAYLRATLSASRNTTGLHPLATEFERLNDYLALMAVRMGPRLTTTLDLPAELRDLPVPPLLLQPLVENAIRHGLEPQVAGGHITVSARLHGSLLELVVSDTGVGLSPNAPTQWANEPATPTPASPSNLVTGTQGHGFGLAQVRERLLTLYGQQGGFILEANFPYGTCAKVTFPIKKS